MCLPWTVRPQKARPAGPPAGPAPGSGFAYWHLVLSDWSHSRCRSCCLHIRGKKDLQTGHPAPGSVFEWRGPSGGGRLEGPAHGVSTWRSAQGVTSLSHDIWRPRPWPFPSSSVRIWSLQMDHDPRSPAYIATQGPLPATVADFWQVSRVRFIGFSESKDSRRA